MSSFRICALMLFAFCLLSCEIEYVKPVRVEYHQQTVDSTLVKDAELENFIQPYREKIEGEMKTVLSYSAKNMFKSDTKYNTAIGNLMADAVLEVANPLFQQKHNQRIDAVLLNYGGIRSGINKGEITVRTVFDVMPFENEIVVVELPYEAVQEMMAYLIDRRTAHPIAGMQIQLKHNYSLAKASIQGEEIKLNDKKEKTYFIATSDYLWQGGDGMDFFTKNNNVYPLNYKLRNLLIDYFGKQKEVNPSQDNRFTVE